MRPGDLLTSSSTPGHATVLCGHTQGRAYVEMLPNLRLKTGEATYGQPAVEEVLSVT